MTRRHSTLASVARLFFGTAAVVTQRVSLMARGALPAREAVRMVAEKPVTFAKATLAAGTAASASVLRRPLSPVQAFADATRAWTRTVTRQVQTNRARLARTRRRK